MNRQKGEKSKTVHVKGHVIYVKSDKMKYSLPKLMIPKDSQGKTTLKKPWFVYFYFENPYTGKMDPQPIKIKEGINRKKTISERKKFGEFLVKGLTAALEAGYNPFIDDTVESSNKESLTVVEALNYAVEQKKGDWKATTLQDVKGRKDYFLSWLKDKGLSGLMIQEVNKRTISNFLNHISNTSSNRNSNNYKSCLSSLFTKLVEDDYLEQNIILNIKKRQTKPTKHKPFSDKDLQRIKNYLLENDQYLYFFMCFVGYGFLRNIEVCRLKDNSFDLDNWTMTVETKTNTYETIRVIKTLQPIVYGLGVEGKRDLFVFTPDQKIGSWTTKERDKVGFFGKRFKKVKEALDLDKDYTIYSMRHTFAVNVYNGLRNQGLTDRETILKMLPITRHKNESGLRNYLRSVNAYVAKDYSSSITIDF